MILLTKKSTNVFGKKKKKEQKILSGVLQTPAIILPINVN